MELYSYTEMRGKEFNDLIKSIGNPKLLKVLNEEKIHHGFQYEMGLNIDTKEFYPYGDCCAGGLYFTTENDICDYLWFGTEIAVIEIPDDARVYIEKKKFKSDRIVIVSSIDIVSFIRKEVNAKPSVYLKQNPELLKYVENQTPKMCMEAVGRFGFVLCHVKDQTPELCLTAVKQNGYALKYIKNQTPELCSIAIQNSEHALEYVKEQTPELCLMTIGKDSWTLQHVREQTPEICLAAVKKNGNVLKYVKDQTPEICTAAVTQNSNAFKYIREQTLRLRLMAVGK